MSEFTLQPTRLSQKALSAYMRITPEGKAYAQQWMEDHGWNPGDARYVSPDEMPSEGRTLGDWHEDVTWEQVATSAQVYQSFRSRDLQDHGRVLAALLNFKQSFLNIVFR
jgi:hypothetical protein